MLVGNGENLHLTPPAYFDYPSFGMNTVHKYEGWTPTYYTAVDSRVMREFGDAITERFAGIPKFIPMPNLDAWQGENFYRFYHRPGPLWKPDSRRMDSDFLSSEGITYGNVMHVAMQLARWMGFTTLLVIGMEHRPAKAQAHFWGCDHGMSAYPPLDDWLEGYKTLVDGFAHDGARVINISENTYVPEEIIPRGDWREWSNNGKKS